VAGQLIQQQLKASSKISEEEEKILLIKAIRINTLSKLTF